MKILIIATAALATFTASPAIAASYAFSYQSNVKPFGGIDQTLQGVFTTSDTPVTTAGETAFAITGISGTLNGIAITGLFASAGPYFYFTTGDAFLDGSGMRFNAGSFTNVAFFQPSVGPSTQYRINGGGNISTLGNASSSLIGGAVPEPGTWVMMILGFGALGFAMRRAVPVRTAIAYG